MPSKGPCRWWIATLNNPKVELSDIYTLLDCQYLTGQREECPTTKTPHYQFVFWYKTPVRFSALTKKLPEAHFEQSYSPKSAIAYCQKSDSRIGDTETYGETPIKLNSKEDWELVFQSAKKGQFEEIPRHILIRHFGNLQKIHTYFASANPQPGVRGIWVYGSPGIGKSYWARQTYPNPYSKPPQNKWWDGYKGQDHVIIDDLDKQHAYIGQYLKNWLDHYEFTGEVKGGTIPINARWIVITSNYHPSQIFTESVLLEAITRRLDKVWFMNDKRELISHDDL